MQSLPTPLATWFHAQGWTLHPHQRDMLSRAGHAATLLIAPTGGGKTLAGFLPTLAELGPTPRPGLHTLYISPLKALTADIRRNLRRPVEGAGLAIRIEDRTGDTTQTQRRRQRGVQEMWCVAAVVNRVAMSPFVGGLPGRAEALRQN